MSIIFAIDAGYSFILFIYSMDFIIVYIDDGIMIYL